MQDWVFRLGKLFLSIKNELKPSINVLYVRNLYVQVFFLKVLFMFCYRKLKSAKSFLTISLSESWFHTGQAEKF